MGQFSVEIMRLPGSLLGENQHPRVHNLLRTALRFSTRSFRTQISTSFVRRSDQPFSAEGAAGNNRSGFDGSFLGVSVINRACWQSTGGNAR